MGIPFYYKNIITNYKSILKDKAPGVCHRFFLDFNSIIHQCAAKVTSKFVYDHNIIISEIINYTMSLIEEVNPTELVYIAIDGVAPRAKMVQQRKRRFITAYKNEMIKNFMQKNMMKHNEWDSNIITPGTSFMNLLDLSLKEYFAKTKLAVKVIVSGSDEEGEGEQKLFNFIRRDCSDNENINIVHGLDADLIMLSLLSDANIYLHRDKDTFVDINEFRKCISAYVSKENPQKNILYDYVFLCVLLGNDFLPNIPFLKIREGAIEMLLTIYRDIYENMNENLVLYNKGSYNINIIFLKEVFKALANMEDENMKYARKQYTDTIIATKFLPNIPEVCDKRLKRFLIDMENYPLFNRHPLTSSSTTFNIWQQEYYYSLFHSNDSNDIHKYAKHYIEGLCWVVNYYYNREFDMFWHYRYHVSPLANDIYKTLLSERDINIYMNKTSQQTLNIKLNPNLQLLYVIPPQSISILPRILQNLMSNPELGLVHYYPAKFDLCTFFKKMLWECTPILPDIDIMYMNKVLSKTL